MVERTTVVTMVRGPAHGEERGWQDREIRDLAIGEVGYTVPWALRVNPCFHVHEQPRGTVIMGIKRTGEIEYEVWFE